LVLGKQKLQCLDVELAVVVAGELGNVEAALLEVLIACRTLLPIPALLVNEGNSRENREPLDGERNVREVGDRTMAVLEIESIEELLGLLLADLLQRFLHRERRARVLCHGIRLYLRLDAMHGKYFGRLLRICCKGGLGSVGL